MTIKNTVFGRHYSYDYVRHTHMTTNDGADFHIDAPNGGWKRDYDNTDIELSVLENNGFFDC